VVSWIHIGDLHMTEAGRQNDRDLQSIVAEINSDFAGSISFVYLPGDVADNGSGAAYLVVRRSLDRLTVPWCAIVGDHDVHEKSHSNFMASMSGSTHYSFTVGNLRFIALNAFDVPHPGSFAIRDEQMLWCARQMEEASEQGQDKIVLLHCYPSELKVGGEKLIELVRRHNVRLVDMGHTHYNEIANDGRTLYTATRSTGQTEEGPVGFSVTNIDGGITSWRFLESGKLPLVVITSPGDERLLTRSDEKERRSEELLRVRAKIWGRVKPDRVQACMGESKGSLHQLSGSKVWEGTLLNAEISDGIHTLRVTAEDFEGKITEDSIRVLIGPDAGPLRSRPERDRDNALAAWPEHGLLGTQLGPNKNGRKW
jgi:hypothetical protein